MTFLKKLGTILLKIVGIASGFIPLVQQTVSGSPTGTKVVNEITQLFGIITTGEQMFTNAFGKDAKLGSDKLKAATPFVAQLVQQSDLLVGKKPQNEQLFEDACTRLTTALADILNSYGE